MPAGPPALAASGGAAVARAARGPATPSTSLQAALAGAPAGTAAAPGEQLAAAAATGVARAEAGQPVAANAAAGLAADVGQPASAAAASVARAEPGADSPAAEAGTAAPQMARAGRPAPGAPSLEVAVVLPGVAGGTTGSRGAAGEPADAAATALARTEPSVAAPAGGTPGDVPASLATEASDMIPSASISRTAAAQTAAGANAAGGGQPDVAADARSRADPGPAQWR